MTPAALRAMLERVVGQAPFGFALYSPDHRYLMINDVLARLNGRSAAEHLGLTVHDVAPELADQIGASLDRVLETGEPIIDTEVVGETPGDPGRLGTWLNSFYRITGPSGELLGVAALARDATEERRMREQLVHERFRAALNASLEPVLVVAARPGPHGGTELWVDYLNPAASATARLRPEEAVGRRLTDLFPVVAELGLDQEYERVFSTGVPFVARGVPLASLRQPGSEERFDVSVTRTPEGLLISWRDSELEQRLLAQQVELLAERQRVAQLQRSFLPRRLPELPGVALAARYRSAERDAPLGGDWYDALALDDQLSLVIGDVAGHGMSAVETMGAARLTARAYLAEDARPEVVLARIDRYLSRVAQAERARLLMTMVAAGYDPATRVLRWSSAGHVPPLVVESGRARLLPSPPRPPVGAGSGGYLAHELAVEPGALVVLYTDGLIERRGESLDVGFARLVRAAGDLPEDPRAVCDALLERCLDPLVHDDDVCLVVLRTS